MASMNSQYSSFTRSPLVGPACRTPGLKPGPNGSLFISSGIPDLDRILGGGFFLGSLVMVMEDPEAPHHLLLLRNFMAQGLLHDQSLFFASPAKDPRAFLGTLPSSISSKDDKSRDHGLKKENGLRIAWQYQKYCGDDQKNLQNRDTKHEYSSVFDLRKPLERHILRQKLIDCFSTADSTTGVLRERCSRFLDECPRVDGGDLCTARLAIQSFCAPQCGYFNKEWDVLSFIKFLKVMVRSSNAVAMITVPQSVLSASLSKRCQHLADTLLSVRAIPDEDKELEKLLTGYHDMVGLLNVQKVARINTQVPLILEATTFSMKLQKRRSLALECLNQAPIDGSSGSSYGTSTSCSGSSKHGTLGF